MAEWARVRLGKLVEVKHGFAFKGEYFSDLPDGPVLVTPANIAIGGGFKRAAREKFYSGPMPDGFVLNAGDLVVTMTDLSKAADALGFPAVIPADRTYLHNQRIGLVRILAEDVLDKKFLYYSLRVGEYHEFVVASATGSTVRHTSPDRICGYETYVPSPGEQQAVVEVLGALDDKIALNERIAITARRLCRASMEAMWAGGGVSSLTGRDAEFGAGWRRTTLGRLCADGGGAIQTGPFGSQLHASDYVESGIPSVMPQNIGDNFISEGGIARIARSDAERLSKYLLAEGDIVYSRRGDVKRRAFVREHEVGWLCGTGCLRVRVGTSTRPLFMSYYLGEPEIQEWIAQHAVGATMPNLNTSILGEVPVVLPPAAVVDRVHERLAALDRSAAHVTHENRTLADLRDTLLPQLITGKLRVKDAARVVEEAV